MESLKIFVRPNRCKDRGLRREVSFWYFYLTFFAWITWAYPEQVLSEYRFIAHNIDALFVIYMLMMQPLIVVFDCLSAIDYW